MCDKISKGKSNKHINQTKQTTYNSNKTLQEDLNAQLDEAIMQMDTAEIDNLLSQMETLTPCPLQPEDSKLFAKRIIKQKNKPFLKGYDFMKNINKKYGTIIAGIAFVFVAGTGVLYATGLLNQITIFRDNGTYTITSDSPLTEEAANAAIDELENNKEAKPDEAHTTEVINKTFDSIDAASKALDVPIVLPSVLPKDFTLSNEINTQSYEHVKGHVNAQIYISYDHPDTTEKAMKNRTAKLFQISIMKNDKTDVSESISKTDAVYDDTYKNALGDTYTMLNEEGARIAHITIGDIEYNLCFFNISDDEMHNIIDHTDLSAYKNIVNSN